MSQKPHHFILHLVILSSALALFAFVSAHATLHCFQVRRLIHQPTSLDQSHFAPGAFDHFFTDAFRANMAELMTLRWHKSMSRSAAAAEPHQPAIPAGAALQAKAAPGRDHACDQGRRLHAIREAARQHFRPAGAPGEHQQAAQQGLQQDDANAVENQFGPMPSAVEDDQANEMRLLRRSASSGSRVSSEDPQPTQYHFTVREA